MYRIYFKCIVAYAIVNVVYADLCYTPGRLDIGECVPFPFCTDLEQLLQNQTIKDNSFLRAYFCEGGNYTNTLVCCSVTNGRFGYVFDEIGTEPQEHVFASTSLKNSEDCGFQSIQSSNNITGGLVSLDEFPWLVYILTVNETGDNDSKYSIACTGTLINSRYVISSAQCIVKAGGASAKFLVAIEEPLKKNISGEEEPESDNSGNHTVFHYYDLDKVLIHPSFNELHILHDIALLKLNTSISFTDHIRPVCLPISESETAKPRAILSTAGYTTWGTKVKVSSFLISNIGCKVIHKRRNIRKYIIGHEMCALKYTDDGCYDETPGNPMLFFDKKRWYINGISSWSANCSSELPKVYTRVSSYLKWIEANTRDAYQDDKISNRVGADIPVTLQNHKECGRQLPEKYNSKDGPIAPDEFPWLVYISAKTQNPTEYLVSCTGSLITSRYVLSGARCFPDGFHLSIQFVVIIEEYPLQNATNCSEFTSFYNRNCSTLNYYQLNDIVIHPSYNRWTYENDIALLRLNDVVTFTDYIRPLCLPLPGFTRSRPGDTLQAASYIKWGVKTKASLRLINNKECKLRLEQMNDTGILHQHEMCAVRSKNDAENSCRHYVSGPIMYRNNSIWYLEAIHSRDCTDNVPTICTRVADYIPWIQANMKDDRCTTPNGNVGECIPLRRCAELLRSFTNPRKEQETYLRKFICENGTKSDFMVCCPRVKKNLTFQNNDEEVKSQETNSITELTNLANCGLQRQPKFSTKDGPIPADEFPWLVSVVSHEQELSPTDYPDYKIRCTGAVINARYVLAGATCFTDDVTALTFFHVSIAEYSAENCTELTPFYTFNCTKLRHFGIDKKIIHPFYNRWTHMNNIALVRLNRIIPFTGYTKPICLRLPRTKTVDSPELIYTGSHTAWTNKVKVSLQLISNTECRTVSKHRNNVLSITEYEMCTIQPAAELACARFITSPIMSFNNHRWYLEGIRPETESCPNEIPEVGPRISNYFQWIQEHVRADDCTTPHGEPGVCKYLKDCPQLHNAFANPEKHDDNQMDHYLHSFECPRNTNPQKRIGDVIIVCCGNSPNFTIRPVPNYKELETNNSREFNNSKYCGLQHTDDYYTTSDNIAIDEYPWTAAIYLHPTRYTTQELRIICTGVLISRRYVLTTASCMKKVSDWARVGIRLGEYNVDNATDCIALPEIETEDCTKAQDYKFDRIKPHDFYDIFSTLNDIALLRLHKKVYFTDYVRPICLPSPKVLYVKPGDRLYSTGWGRNTIQGEKIGDEAQIKKKIRTVLISNEQCSKSQHKIYDSTAGVSVSQFCTRDFRNETEFLCDLDVGGPLMTRYKHKWYVIGVSSRNICNQKIPQIHTNVTYFLGWIRRYIDFN